MGLQIRFTFSHYKCMSTFRGEIEFIVNCNHLFYFHLHAVILILINIYGIKLTVQVTMLFSGLKLLAIVFIVAVGVITVGVRQCVPERLHQPFQLLECHEPSVSSVALALYGVL